MSNHQEKHPLTLERIIQLRGYIRGFNDNQWGQHWHLIAETLKRFLDNYNMESSPDIKAEAENFLKFCEDFEKYRLLFLEFMNMKIEEEKGKSNIK